MKPINLLAQKLKGYHRHFRGRFLLLKNKVLTEEEYILWDLSFSTLADWDKQNHPDNYGTFNYTQEEIASLLGWHKTKVCRLSKSLFQKGFWIRQSDGKIRVVGYDILENLTEITKESGVVDLQEYVSKMQLENAEMKQEVPNSQPFSFKENINIQTQEVAKMQLSNAKAPLVSSKSKYRVLRTDEEYQKIWEEGNYTMLTIDDMKWIDKNIPENTQI